MTDGHRHTQFAHKVPCKKQYKFWIFYKEITTYMKDISEYSITAQHETAISTYHCLTKSLTQSWSWWELSCWAHFKSMVKVSLLPSNSVMWNAVQYSKVSCVPLCPVDFLVLDYQKWCILEVPNRSVKECGTGPTQVGLLQHVPGCHSTISHYSERQELLH